MASTVLHARSYVVAGEVGHVSALRGLPVDRLLDMAISDLRGRRPARATVAPVKPLKFHLVRVPPGGPRANPA